MNAEDFFNRANIVELSFFNFRNALSAAYFAGPDFTILKVNDNFRKFFPVLGKITNASFLDVLEQLGVSAAQIQDFRTGLEKDGHVLIPEIQITIDGEERMYSLLSARTVDENFSYLNGIQGQFVDRTVQWRLRREREKLVAQKLRDSEIIEEKTRQLEELATRLAKYLSPQVYESIFSGRQDAAAPTARKNLSVFYSDIAKFAALSDHIDPERVAKIINSYFSEMSTIALEFGGTIDKFIGDAILVFFGDPESQGDEEDARRAVEMALRMQERIEELQGFWRKNGASSGIKVRMAIATGFCTVGNFGSDQRLEYTAVGGAVNLAARMQELAPEGSVLISENTYNLVGTDLKCNHFSEMLPKGFARPVQLYQVEDFTSDANRDFRRKLSRTGEHVEVNVINGTDIRAAIEELRRIQEEFEALLG